MGIILWVLAGLAFIGYVVYSIKDGNKVLFKEGTWMRLADKYLMDNDDNDPEYIRLECNITKSLSEEQWSWYRFSYFEPDGAVYEKNGTWGGGYSPVDAAMADKLEKAYVRKLDKQTKETSAKKAAEKKAALDAFLA